MRPSGIPGRRVFIQDSDRPAIGNKPIYTHHRKVVSKPEKRFGDFSRPLLLSEKQVHIILSAASARLRARIRAASAHGFYSIYELTRNSCAGANNGLIGSIQPIMASVQSQEEIGSRIRLLREVVELLMWELSAISNRKWRSFRA